jgi:hypothetical protein
MGQIKLPYREPALPEHLKPTETFKSYEELSARNDGPTTTVHDNLHLLGLEPTCQHILLLVWKLPVSHNLVCFESGGALAVPLYLFFWLWVAPLPVFEALWRFFRCARRLLPVIADMRTVP